MLARRITQLCFFCVIATPLHAAELDLEGTYGLAGSCGLSEGENLEAGMSVIGGDKFKVAGTTCEVLQTLAVSDGSQVATMACSYSTKTTIEQFRIVKIGESEAVEISNAAGKVLGRLTRCL